MNWRDMNWNGETELVDRLLNPLNLHEKFSFVVGSACSTAAREDEPGVPGVEGFIEFVLEMLSGTPALEQLREKLEGGSTDRYQTALAALQEARGQEAVGELIQKTTLRALQPEGGVMPRYAIDDKKRFRVPMDEVYQAWWIPPAVDAIGGIVAENGLFFGMDILTTNFDPLLELAIQKSGMPFARVALDADGDLNAFGGTACRVIHLHGYWRATRTLHTPQQLSAHRPRLRSSLEQLLQHRTAIVVGYGGWDDVFMRALTDATMALENSVRVLWLFYPSKPEEVAKSHAHVLDALKPAIAAGRAELFTGIDAHAVMPGLRKALADKSGVLRLALRNYIREAFGIEQDELRQWDESVKDSLPAWRQMVEDEFETKRESLENIHRGVLKKMPGVTAERLAEVWFENLLIEKYRFLPPAWMRNT